MKLPNFPSSATAIEALASMKLCHDAALCKVGAPRFSTAPLYSDENDYAVVVVEATLALYFQLRNANSKSTIVVSFCSYYHAITGKSCTGSTLRFLDTLADELHLDLPWFQSGFGWVDVLDGLYTNTKRVVKSALGNKLAKVFNHVVAKSLYDKAGIELDPVLFGEIEKKHIRPNVWNVMSFVDAIVGLVLFLCKAGRQALATGSVECFFIDDMVLTNWLDKAARLRKDAEFLNNPSAVGMALPQYLFEVKEAIDLGKKLLPHFKSGREHTTLLNVLLELEMIQKRQQVTMMAASFRRAPVGVFLYGTAGVAKSFIAGGLFHHYCSVRGISKEAAVMWTRTENDDYYSGYKSHFAAVLYDDAAKYRANVVQGVDSSIKDIISAINNIQFVTPQADLPDKGKVPFRSEWVGVTSNVDDLSSNLYFNSSAAFLRRFAVRIEPIVKEEFRCPGEDKIDTTKIPEGVQYPDLWDFRVCVPKVEGKQGKFVEDKYFQHYSDLLEYMTGVYEKHIAQQDKLMATVGQIGPEELCKCRLPVSICKCGGQEDGHILFGDVSVMPQSDVETEPDHSMLFGSVPREHRCAKKHYLRLSMLIKHKKELMLKHTDKVVRAFIEQEYEMFEVAKWFNVDYCDPIDFPYEDHVMAHRVTSHIHGAVGEFLALDGRDRLNLLSDGIFARVDDSPDLTYLTFQPRVGKRGHFMETQLERLRGTILSFCGSLSAKETALLDVYVQEEAPRHIASGWPLGDVIKGGYDYVKHYSQHIEDPERIEAREFLLGTRESRWYERLGVRVAVAYFEKRWVYRTLNFLSAIPVVQWGVGWAVKKASGDPRQVMATAGLRYDRSLGGDNVVLRRIMLAVSFMGVAALIAKFVMYFKSRGKHEEVPIDARSERAHGMTDSVAEALSDCEAMPEEQMDLLAVGRKPTVRDEEAKNVWTVKERAISRLDVDARRPHNSQQLLGALENNILFARVYGEFRLGKGKCNTRIIVVDSETFVANNHALIPGSRIEIWLGPVKEEGVSPSFVVELDERMCTRIPERDVVIVKSWGMPHRFKDIKHLFVKRTFSSVGASAYYIQQMDGTQQPLLTVGATLSGLRGLSGAEDVVCEAWRTHPTRPTVSGECGSPLVVHCSLGSVIVGMHAGYDAVTNTAWAVRLFREDFDDERHPEIGITRPAYPLAQVGVLKLGPNDKLYTDYHRGGHLMTHGQLKSFIARPKFTGRYTPHAPYVFRVGSEFQPPIEDNMAAPRNSGWKQPQMVLENYLHPTHSMNEIVVRSCVEAFCERIESGLSKEDLEDIHPVPISVAVNGFPGVPNVDAQKHATSAGHGKRGPKLQFLSEPEKFEEWESYRSFNDVTVEEINDMREKMYEGVRPHAIYDACWKNEMLSKAKVEAGRARAIYMCPLAFLVNMRMSTLGLCRVMIRKRDLFCIAVGLNTHSEQWDDVFKLAQKIPGSNWVAGDFRAFESVLGLLLSNAVSKIIVFAVVLSRNYSALELMALRVMLADISSPTVNFFGELLTFLGGEASGQQLTTFFNCLANVLLHMYSYVMIHKKSEETSEYLRCAREFFDMVFCNTLGDDVYMKVHPNRPTFNHTSIQAVFASIGIEYTMADKGAASRAYIPLEEVTFLKRSFVDHSAFPGMKVAALDRKSIYKMLCYTVPSHTASLEEQLASALASAQAEAFFHDYEFFAQISDLIAELPKSPELEFRMKQLPPPSWDQMVLRFVKASPKLRVKWMVPEETETPPTEHSYCHVSDLELQTRWSVDAWGSTTMGRSPEDRIYGGVRLSAKLVPTGGECEATPDPDNASFTKNILKTNKNTHTTKDREMAPKVVMQAINKVRSQVRKTDRRKKWMGDAQADIAYDTTSLPTGNSGGGVDVVQEQVVFKNEPTGVVLHAPKHNDAIASSMRVQQDVGSYLNRPALIYSFAWTENGPQGAKVDFDPWRLFFNSGSMREKLQGYTLLRCRLKLKFLINGSPFYYGSIMATYTPLNDYRLDTAEVIGLETRLTASSQKPHVWLENQNCSTAQMELPFLYPYPYINLRESGSLEGMGTVHLIQYAPLLSANGTSSSSVDIQVYAWAEDVQLSGPTHQPVAQSEFVADGQVSGPASSVARVAGSLSNVPVIGPYARATEMAATKLGDMAKFLGFTNVPDVSDVKSFKPIPFSLASTEISEPVQKLSLQAKQETAVGAEHHGGESEDELHIVRFAGRSAYIARAVWSTTLAPGNVLFTTGVCPQMFTRTSTEIAHSPMSYLANFFQYWRGSIKYTFRVVRSPYHRGRLQVSWDAGTRVMSNGAAVGNPNTLTTVMDLDEDSECSFVVPYMQKELFTKTYSIKDTGTEIWSTNATPTGTWNFANGILSVRVLNRLTAPEASSDVSILVFASACDDIEFAGPRDYLVYTGSNILGLDGATVGVAQSDVVYNDEAEAAELMPRGDDDHLYNLVFGEKVASMREYMHRSSLSFRYATPNIGSGTGCAMVRVPIKRIPPQPGVANNGWWLGTTSSGAGQTVFYTKFHPLLAISACFIGYKGSVNVNVNVDQTSASQFMDTLQVYRVCNADVLTSADRMPRTFVLAEGAQTPSLSAKSDIQILDAGRSGMALTNTKTNAGMSVQLPYYSSSAFHMCDPRREYNNQDGFTDRNNDWWNIEWRFNKATADTGAVGNIASVFYATGPDFDLIYFINVPVLKLVSVVAV